MKQVLVTRGQVSVEEVPAPTVAAGTVLVRVRNSCISVGTELSNIRVSETPLWKRAVEQPEKAKTALRMVRTEGLSRTIQLVRNKVEVSQPTGYSAAGVVLEVGEGIDDIQPGDRVACAGAQCAFHAEIIRVPRNLTVRVPDGLDFAMASMVTLGAIALQGVRRASPTLGETFVVIGLGVIGQLTAQLLKANGCQVVGVDMKEERISLARELGLDLGLDVDADGGSEQVARLTGGTGADGVIITASTASDEVVSSAFQMCRQKGRVVLVGDVGLDLNRWDFYYKELDFFISTSYGPGRYAQNYEERNLDYPIGYVRWTENRNMEEFLRLVAEGHVKVAPLVSATYPIDEARSAYELMKDSQTLPPVPLLSYPESTADATVTRMVENPTVGLGGRRGPIRIAVAGAGDFAKLVHLPNLKNLSEHYQLRAVMSRTGHNARQAAQQFGAAYATTDWQAILNDSEVDAVLIATRHNLHAAMVLEALNAGKHVLVEKPLSLNREELSHIERVYGEFTEKGPAPLLLTGFNRRFSRYASRIHELVEGRTNPMILNYRMNAGHVPLDNWVHSDEGGGRNRGEACHIYDLFTYLTASRMVSVSAQAISPSTGYYVRNDNFVATISFEDGSVATLTYVALGTSDYPKEQMELFVDGQVVALDNYTKLSVHGAKKANLETRMIEKGHEEELAAFAAAISQGREWPIPLWQQVQTTEIAFRVEELLMGSL